jgi:hypothetical protein
MRNLFLCITLLFTVGAWAYPNFIGHGYNSCLTCHYNPLGNGPLTDYGRALGATAISSKDFTSSTDEAIGQSSGFLYNTPKNTWFRPSIDYRGLFLTKNYSGKTEESSYIHMQASANVVLRLGPSDNKDKYIVVGTFGYAPTPKAKPDSDESNYRSREHYVGMRINEKWGVYAGMMDKAFGIRLPDHIVISRQLNNLTMNDGTHGLLVHYATPKIDFAFQPFLGNLGQDAQVRQVGFSSTGEYNISDKTRLGASLLSSKSDFVEQFSYAAHLRSAFGKGSSIMFEVGQINKAIVLANAEKSSRYGTLQNHIRAKKGLYILNTVEFFIDDIEKENKLIRWGPGFQYYPMQRVEIRTDIYNTRIFSESSVSEDNWDLTGQVHLWF